MRCQWTITDQYGTLLRCVGHAEYILAFAAEDGQSLPKLYLYYCGFHIDPGELVQDWRPDLERMRLLETKVPHDD